MEKKIFITFSILNILLLGGCKSGVFSRESESEVKEYNYRDIDYLIIPWENIFNINSNDYFVYVYSLTCSHCNEIKQEIISYALTHDDFYLVTMNDSIPLIRNPNTTIGATKYQDVGIAGTPTLLQIKDHILINNVAGTTNVTYLLFGK